MSEPNGQSSDRPGPHRGPGREAVTDEAMLAALDRLVNGPTLADFLGAYHIAADGTDTPNTIVLAEDQYRRLKTMFDA